MLPEIIEYLANAAQLAPSADNSQPWRFSWDGEYFTIQLVDDNCKTQCLEIDHPAMLFSLGCVTENISQAIEKIKNSPIKAEFIPDQYSVRFRIMIDDYLFKIDKDSNTHPLFSRHTNRFPFQKKPLPFATKEDLLQLSENEAKIHIFETKDEINFWATLIRIASEVRFQSQDIHEWLGESLRLTESAALSNDGLDAKTIDLPPGGKLLLKFTKPWSRMKFLNNFGLYKLFAAIESMQIKKAACLVCITAPFNSKGIFDAGILMERAWIYLNHIGLSVHPYFVLPDQLYRFYENKIPQSLAPTIAQIVDKVEKMGFGKEHHLQIILRVGIATKTPYRSRRHKAIVTEI